ncbi:MAG: alpha/beta hydrolase [Bryobacteraceae bacterium]|nr:alpha/beta hydrolase [Bryobacteraceae bacterium]
MHYEKRGAGPALVLVHGSFSDHATNWEFATKTLEERFTVYALARRGRGETPATVGHSIDDEGRDVAEVVLAIGEPVFLLGHSYGAQVALNAAARVPDRVRKLILYEPPWPSLLNAERLAVLESLAAGGDWSEFAYWFFQNILEVPADELDAVRASEGWAPILKDAAATLHDLRALAQYDFRPERFAALRMPVLMQTGTESPRHLWATDALLGVLPDVREGALAGQAHEGMTTAPELYARAVIEFLL